MVLPWFGDRTAAPTAFTIENHVLANYAYCPSIGIAEAMNILLNVTTAAKKVKGILYNSALDLVGVTEERTIPAVGVAWYRFRFYARGQGLAKPRLFPRWYWLGGFGELADGLNQMYYNNAGGNAVRDHWSGVAYPTVPDPLAGDYHANYWLSIYCEYKLPDRYCKSRGADWRQKTKFHPALKTHGVEPSKNPFPQFGFIQI